MAQQEHGERDLLAGNARYKKLQDLNEGTFGVVMLALDTHAREQVCLLLMSSNFSAMQTHGAPVLKLTHVPAQPAKSVHVPAGGHQIPGEGCRCEACWKLVCMHVAYYVLSLQYTHCGLGRSFIHAQAVCDIMQVLAGGSCVRC